MITYDSEGERQHTIYLGAAPEYGKKSFLERLEREIEREVPFNIDHNKLKWVILAIVE
jgi:hypothetical protein